MCPLLWDMCARTVVYTYHCTVRYTSLGYTYMYLVLWIHVTRTVRYS